MMEGIWAMPIAYLRVIYVLFFFQFRLEHEDSKIIFYLLKLLYFNLVFLASKLLAELAYMQKKKNLF